MVSNIKVHLLKGHPFEACVIFWKWLEEDGDLRYDAPFEIDAEKLHKYLKVSQDFKKWFNNVIKEWGYSEDNFDFFPKFRKESKRRKNYILSLNMAQELAVLEGGSPEGNEARKQIRELKRMEKKWKHDKKLKEGWRLLTHPTHRDGFLQRLSVFWKLDTYDARDELEYRVKVTCPHL